MLRNKNENSLAIALERCARFGVKPGLEAVRAVCAAMDNPQDSLRVVHVAGTNGKGAVCALIDSALRAAGFRTGRYTSPHLVSLNERFFLDGAPVSTEKLNAACSTLNPQLSTNLTYFELLTATAFELYRREKVDYLVLETGLGGRLDATNIVKKPAVSIITRIGLDHCDWLGHTIAEIAAEKGGIIKPEVPVVLGAMPDDARHVLERIAVERHAPCLYAPENSKLETGNPKLKTLNLQGTFNRENAVTAFAALKVLGIADSAIARGFASVVWPGRYQRLTVGDRRILVDGAHNPPAMRALVDSLKAEPQESEGGFPVRSVLCGFCGFLCFFLNGGGCCSGCCSGSCPHGVHLVGEGGCGVVGNGSLLLTENDVSGDGDLVTVDEDVSVVDELPCLFDGGSEALLEDDGLKTPAEDVLVLEDEDCVEVSAGDGEDTHACALCDEGVCLDLCLCVSGPEACLQGPGLLPEVLQHGCCFPDLGLVLESELAYDLVLCLDPLALPGVGGSVEGLSRKFRISHSNHLSSSS